MSQDWFNPEKLTIIAEVGLNHNGSISSAIELAEVAKEAGCDSVKFQLRSPSTFLNIKGHRDIGSEIVDEYIKKTFIDFSGYEKIWRECTMMDIHVFFSVWDLDSLRFAESLGVDSYKIGSGDMRNTLLLEEVFKTRKPFLISTGMSSEDEVDDLINRLGKTDSEYGIFHCHSAYPAPDHHLNLSYINRLKTKCRCPIGYSSHDLGSTASLVAVSLGATILEKHITLDRNSYGNDHSVSLEPSELIQYVSECQRAFQMLGSEQPRTIGPGEKFNKISLTKSIIAKSDIPAGSVLTPSLLDFYPSGEGLSPESFSKYMHKKTVSPLSAGQLITRSIFVPEEDSSDLSELMSGRLIGFPVRYRDITPLSKSIPSSYLEIHMSYRDVFADIPREIETIIQDNRIGFHAPDIYEDNLIFDPFSHDKDLALRSTDSFKILLDHLKNFHQQYRLSYPLNLVVSFSSYTEYSHDASKAKLYPQINDFIDKCISEYPSISILPQSLPALAWYLGGQRYVNTFAHPKEILEFAREYNKKICLDLSHLMMACNFYGVSFETYSDLLADHAGHYHLAGASGIDDEGLNLVHTKRMHPFLSSLLKHKLSGNSAIVETWQGHLDQGAGFKKDLLFLASLVNS
ncbi:N-acetylneuraminate synthase family protein [Synechococcus sp. LTW-R]|uniref:N-acetylneuraminate synthase family protein n=1 Tax=Synechococcus sp. LTW-R TaxID=2751170 RepID=UPI001627BF9C|nr:N-acetylneuraminate synthase family protein [Synechococcus sp. LTW-R]QNG28943.1 N-acetylneuraminate synthase family protein [Synechococcus sp. LTW-R]